MPWPMDLELEPRPDSSSATVGLLDYFAGWELVAPAERLAQC